MDFSVELKPLVLVIIRKIRITDLASRNRVERLCICIQIFNKVFLDWMKTFVPLAIVSLSCGFVITTFVTIRDVELPTLLYCGFPIVACTLMAIIFWVSHDVVMARRASEEIVENLQSATSLELQKLDRVARKEIFKRAKALKTASIPIGNFGEITFELPVTVWEESVDQLLVLLNLPA